MDVQALTVSPPRQSIIVDPGGHAELPLFIINEEGTPVTVTTEVDAFIVDEKSGTALFGQPSIAKTWVVPREKKVTLQSGESASVTFDVRVPENAKTGAHYLGLFAVGAAGEGNIGARSRIGSLVFLHVAGEVQEHARITDFSTDQYIISKDQMDVFIRIENESDIHIIPEGTVSIVGEDTAHDINARGEKILADQAGTVRVQLPLDSISIGKHVAHVEVTYGVTRQQLFADATFYYIPMWFRFAVGGVILLLIIGVGFLYSKK